MLLLKRESMSLLKLGSILTTIFGCCVLILVQSGSESQENANPHYNFLLGNIFLAFNCFGAGIYVVLLQPVAKKVNVIAINVYCFIFGGIPIIGWLLGYVMMYGDDCLDVLTGKHAGLVWAAVAYACMYMVMMMS